MLCQRSADKLLQRLGRQAMQPFAEHDCPGFKRLRLIHIETGQKFARVALHGLLARRQRVILPDRILKQNGIDLAGQVRIE